MQDEIARFVIFFCYHSLKRWQCSGIWDWH